MVNLLSAGSIVAAFFAGGVALFAPCCIVFLLPSYLAAAVRQRRWRLLPLTFVFASGLALVMLPITLGISLVAATVSKYHAALYYTGGGFMIALALLALSGRMIQPPAFLRTPSTGRYGYGTMFTLGVFSGIATSCCAPVLAGVMTLSALSGSPIGATLLGVAYVFGMTFPLFMIALLSDRFHLNERRFLSVQLIRFRFAGRRWVTSSVNVLVAVAFFAMGTLVVTLGATGKMSGGPAFEVAFGRTLSRVFATIDRWLAPVPEPILGFALLALAGVFVWATLADRNRPLVAKDPFLDEPGQQQADNTEKP